MKNNNENCIFTYSTMAKYLPKKDYKAILSAIKTNSLYTRIDLIKKYAKALEKWINLNNIEYYCHYFVPISGVPAGKQISLRQYPNNILHIEKFNFNDLICTETDASSFFCEGIATTANAKGVVVWDYNLLPFFVKRDGKKIMYLPSVFVYYNSYSLDLKVPLYRAKAYFKKQFVTFMKYFKIKAEDVDIFTGFEQEYFLFNKKEDFLTYMLPSGRCISGKFDDINQKDKAHYFAKIDSNVLCFMNDVDSALASVGVMPKIRHKEVAPNQYELVPVFDDCINSCDKDVLTTTILKDCAHKNKLIYEDFEKPFAKINGSGKHLNWSIWADKKLNLIDYKQSNHFYYWFMLAIILKAVHEYGDLLALSIFSYGNQFRLGASEAPPLKITVNIGDELLHHLTNHDYSPLNGKKNAINFGYALPLTINEFCDRNRTSPFVYNGSKFEFRALGSKTLIHFPCTVLYAILGKACNDVLNEINLAKGDFVAVLNKIVDSNIDVVFNGDNYAKNENLSQKNEIFMKKTQKNDENIEFLNNKDIDFDLSPNYFYKLFTSPKIINFFEETGVLNKDEINARAHFFASDYITKAQDDGKALLKIINNLLTQMEDKAQSIKQIYKAEKKMLFNTQNNNLHKNLNNYDKYINLQKNLEKLLKNLKNAKNLEQKLNFATLLTKLIDDCSLINL